MSPIPVFDHNHVLPPHLGNPISRDDLSPYSSNTIELCERFATSTPRIQILQGLLAFREKMNQEGIIQGFQWLDGSFLENIEVSENRAPRDLDLVTFFGGLSQEQQISIQTSFPEFISPTHSKTTYKLDHYPVDYTYSPDVTVEQTRYWLQLFSHNRVGVWKGIVRLPINTPGEDQQAIEFLKTVVI